MKHERELIALPVPACPDIEQAEDRVDTRRKYHRFTAEVVELGGDKILCITVIDGTGKAQYRFFHTPKQYGMQVFKTEAYSWHKTREPGKMYEGGVENIYASYWGESEREVLYGTERDEQTVIDYLTAAAKLEGNSPPVPGKSSIRQMLVEAQAQQRRRTLRIRDDKAKAAMRARFEGLGEIDDAFTNWCIEAPLKGRRFFVYDYTGKRIQSGSCTHCGKSAELPGIRSHRRGVCPNCGSAVTYISSKQLGHSRQTTSTQTAIYELTLRQDIVCRIINVGLTVELDGFGRPVRKVWHCEIERDYINIFELRVNEGYSNRSGTYKVTVDGMHKDDYYSSTECWIYPAGLDELLSLINAGRSPMMQIRTPLKTLAERGLYLQTGDIFLRAADVAVGEYLVKMGLYRLAGDELGKAGRRYGAASALLKGKTATEVLGLPMQEIKKLIAVDAGANTLVIVRGLYKSRLELTANNIADIQRLGLSCDDFRKLEKLVFQKPVSQVLKYLSKQTRKSTYCASHVLQQWSDYLSMARALGFDLNDEIMFFPRDVLKAHAEATAAAENQKNKTLQKRMANTAAELEPMCWTHGGYCIRPAHSIDELIHEGETLHHCVGKMGYDKKMAAKESAIFFIRKTKTPDIPLATLELGLEKITVRQCYAENDRYPGDAVKKFYNKWFDEVVSQWAAGMLKPRVEVMTA